MTKQNIKRTISAAILVVGFGLASFIFRIFFVSDSSRNFNPPAVVIIQHGTSLKEISLILARSGVIDHPRAFVLLSKIRGLDKKIRAGRFRFPHALSTWRALDALIRGGWFDIPVTIPEGFTIYHIAGTLSRTLGMDSSSFTAACADTKIINALGIPGKTAEGFLFPETYYMPPKISPDSAISIMFSEFKRRWKREYQERADSMGMSMYEIVTLASIIESEAHIKEEQPIISSVYHNRLHRGMLLQADPTAMYGLKKFDIPPTLTDLQDTSQYNTYRWLGLPIGPICNPGEDAIKSALYPAKTDFLYFVSRGNGTHIFSQTLEQHNAAIKQVRQRTGK